jgi:branched-chain amino acid transport system ATP-binding protein
MSETMLKVEGLQGWYGRAQVLFGIDFDVRRGEVVALMGRNGAGKSTTMKAIMGLLEKRRGAVSFLGRDIARLPSHRIARLGLGFSDLTVMENLEIGRQPPRPGLPAWTPQRLFQLFPNLGAMPARPGARISGGEQQMLTVARTLMGNPLLVLLDEPSEGVAPLIVEQMAATIIELKRAGVAILLSEQNLHFARLVSDRAYVLEKGQIRFAGSMQQLEQDPEVRQAYLEL